MIEPNHLCDAAAVGDDKSHDTERQLQSLCCVFESSIDKEVIEDVFAASCSFDDAALALSKLIYDKGQRPESSRLDWVCGFFLISGASPSISS